MAVPSSIFLIAVGAILRFAVSVTSTGFNLHTIGLILMLAGILGLLISLFLWSSWNGRAGGGYRRERRVRSDGAGGYVEEERRGPTP